MDEFKIQNPVFELDGVERVTQAQQHRGVLRFAAVHERGQDGQLRVSDGLGRVGDDRYLVGTDHQRHHDRARHPERDALAAPRRDLPAGGQDQHVDRAAQARSQVRHVARPAPPLVPVATQLHLHHQRLYGHAVAVQGDHGVGPELDGDEIGQVGGLQPHLLVLGRGQAQPGREQLHGQRGPRPEQLHERLVGGGGHGGNGSSRVRQFRASGSLSRASMGRCMIYCSRV